MWNCPTIVRVGLMLVTAVSIDRGAIAQERIWYAESSKPQEWFGASVAITSDFDGDGHPELLIGASGFNCSGQQEGKVGLFSITGGELSYWCGREHWEGFGDALSTIADVDADGIEDLIIGAPIYTNWGWGNDSGRVVVVSSVTGATLMEVVGTHDANLGAFVAGLPDLDGDGYAEVLVGEPYWQRYGRALLLSSYDGTVIREHDGEDYDHYFGGGVSCLGDVDADGMDDYAIDAPWFGDKDEGKTYVYSGSTGALLHSWVGASDQDKLGRASDAGDLDADGFSDLLCAGQMGPSRHGHVDAISGKTGTLLFRIDCDDTSKYSGGYGWGLASVGDMNGDGFEEILVGVPFDHYHGGGADGRADLLCGRTHRLLYRFKADYAFAIFGRHVAGRADFNGDQIPDVVISAVGERYSRPKSGRVSIFAGNDLFLQADHADVLVGESVTLATRGGPSGALSLLVINAISGTLMFSTIDIATLDTNGESAFTDVVPNSASGYSFALVAYAQDLIAGGVIDSGVETIVVQ